MALYPSQLTPEEKALKKIYIRLLEKRKQLKKANEKSVQQTAPKASVKEVLTPKDAKEAAKRLISSGRVSLVKKSPSKKGGFKRVGQLPGQAPATKKPAAVPEPTPPKPKVKAADQKALYSRFVKAANPSEELERIPKRQPNAESSSPTTKPDQAKFSSKECTICVHTHPGIVGESALRTAFKRFGNIKALTVGGPHKNSSFVTFTSPSIAATAKKEMDKGMIHGSDISVEFASTENGYIELPPDAADHDWVKIAAGRGGPPSKKPSGSRNKHKITTYDEPDF